MLERVCVTREEAERLFYDHFDLVSRMTAAAARHFTTVEAEEFDIYVSEKLCEDDYRRIRAYTGRSGATFKAFLATVIGNLLHDFRDRLWGRFRPTEGAKRKGTHAVVLERLLREHHTLDEAFEIMKARFGIALTRSEVEELARHINPRFHVRVETAPVAHLPDGAPSPEELAIFRQMLERYCELLRHLRSLCESLGVEDALILKYRFEDGRKAGDIETLLGLKRSRPRGKALFRRIEHLAERLRKTLQAAGFAADDIRLFLANPGLGDGCDDPIAEDTR